MSAESRALRGDYVDAEADPRHSKFSESPEKPRRASGVSNASSWDGSDDPQVRQLREAIEQCRVDGGKLPPPPGDP